MPLKDPEKRKEYCRQYHKKWYNDNKVKVLQKRKIVRKDNREWYHQYKEDLKCCKCGFDHPAALEFHHRDREDKEMNIASMLSAKSSIESIKKEIEKCDILCGNCHRILHWEEKQTNHTDDEGA